MAACFNQKLKAVRRYETSQIVAGHFKSSLARLLRAPSGSMPVAPVMRVNSQWQNSMRKFRGIIDHLHHQIGVDKELVRDRKHGEIRDFEIQAGARVDVTDTSVKAAEARIIRNGQLIEAYEKKDAALEERSN